MCPQAAQRRRCSHQPGDAPARHSAQPLPLGGTLGSISFVTLAIRFSFAVASRRGQRHRPILPRCFELRTFGPASPRPGTGGGIDNDGEYGTATATFTDTSTKTGTSVDHNTATEGGGISNKPGNGTATLSLDNSSTVSHNTATATDGGGGIFNNGGTLIGAVAPPTPGADVKNNTPDKIVG